MAASRVECRSMLNGTLDVLTHTWDFCHARHVAFKDFKSLCIFELMLSFSAASVDST